MGDVKQEQPKSNIVHLKVFQNMQNGKKRRELGEKLNSLALSLGELENKLLDSSLSVSAKFSIQLQIESIKAQQHETSIQIVNLLDEDYDKPAKSKHKP